MRHHIALWDVCHAISLTGIPVGAFDPRTVQANDLPGLLRCYRQINRVFVVGRTATELLDRLDFRDSLLSARQMLPSTGPTHTTLPFAEKRMQWSAVLPGSESPAEETSRATGS